MLHVLHDQPTPRYTSLGSNMWEARMQSIRGPIVLLWCDGRPTI